MTTLELVELHKTKALALLQDKSLKCFPSKRADQLTISMRHLLCCWILIEATEEELLRLSNKLPTNYEH